MSEIANLNYLLYRTAVICTISKNIINIFADLSAVKSGARGGLHWCFLGGTSIILLSVMQSRMIANWADGIQLSLKYGKKRALFASKDFVCFANQRFFIFPIFFSIFWFFWLFLQYFDIFQYIETIYGKNQKNWKNRNKIGKNEKRRKKIQKMKTNWKSPKKIEKMQNVEKMKNK